MFVYNFQFYFHNTCFVCTVVVVLYTCMYVCVLGYTAVHFCFADDTCGGKHERQEVKYGYLRGDHETSKRQHRATRNIKYLRMWFCPVQRPVRSFSVKSSFQSQKYEIHLHLHLQLHTFTAYRSSGPTGYII
jgi:hypothetical protein